MIEFDPDLDASDDEVNRFVCYLQEKEPGKRIPSFQVLKKALEVTKAKYWLRRIGTSNLY